MTATLKGKFLSLLQGARPVVAVVVVVAAAVVVAVARMGFLVGTEF